MLHTPYNQCNLLEHCESQETHNAELSVNVGDNRDEAGSEWLQKVSIFAFPEQLHDCTTQRILKSMRDRHDGHLVYILTYHYLLLANCRCSRLS